MRQRSVDEHNDAAPATLGLLVLRATGLVMWPPAASRSAFRLALGVISLSAGIVASEIALRIVGFSAIVFERPDSIRGTTLRPGMAGWQAREGRAYVAINSYGYRDKEWTLAKPAGTYRVAVLGDSFVEGRQVALEHTFPALMERSVAGDPTFAEGVEVLNFGVAGYGTAQEWLTLSGDVFRFQPDHVILAFFTGNDVNDNSKVLSHPLDTRPYFTLRGDDLLHDATFVLSPAFQDRSSWAAKFFYVTQPYSRLVQLLYRARRIASQAGAPPRSVPESAFTQTGLPHAVYKPPTSATWEDAWRVTERLLIEMHRACVTRGVSFSVVTLSTPPQVFPEATRRHEFAQQLGVSDLFYPDRRIQAVGARAGFDVLMLAPVLQAYSSKHHVMLHGFPNTVPGVGHWNEQAHRLAAEHIASWLRTKRPQLR